MAKYREIAAELRRAIEAGVYAPGDRLPTVAELAGQYNVSRPTVQAAIGLLGGLGLVRGVPGTGVVVLGHRLVHVPFSRYSQTASDAGPWETACRMQGTPGTMEFTGVHTEAAAADVAAALGLGEGDQAVCRVRHALIGDGLTRVAQLQTAWYPLALASGTLLMSGEKQRGGTYRVLADLGHTHVTADERVRARSATDEEAAELRLRGGPVLVIERTTRSEATGQPLEFLRVVADAAYTELAYDGLRLNLATGTASQAP